MFHVGDVVRKLRLERGWTIPQLAAHANLNKMTVSGIEKGDNHTRDSVTAIAKALGYQDGASFETRLDAWAEMRIGPVVLRQEWRELIALWEVLDADPEAQRLLLGLIRKAAQSAQLAPAPPASPDTHAGSRRSRTTTQHRAPASIVDSDSAETTTATTSHVPLRPAK